MDFDTWWFPRTKRRKTEIEKAEKEEAHIEEAEIEELQDNNQVTDYEESLQIDKIQENDDDHEQSTNTDIKQEQKIEITIGETNVAAQENEDNLTTIEEHTDTKDSFKTTESELFREAENNNDRGSTIQEGVQQSVQSKDSVPSRLNNAEITGKYTQAVQFLVQREQTNKIK